jgi:hypothetical protein
LTRPQGEKGKHLKLQLSAEHLGFRFEAKLKTAVNLLQYHSGGKVKEFENVTVKYFPKEIAAQGELLPQSMMALQFIQFWRFGRLVLCICTILCPYYILCEDFYVQCRLECM